MATNYVVPSNTIDLRLPMQPDIKDGSPGELFRELMIIYTAIRQLQNGTDKYLDIPPNYKTAPYTIAYTDRGQSIDTDANVTIPKESVIGYQWPLGTTISIVNTSNADISIIPASGVTLILAGTTTTGTRTLGNWGVACIRRIGTDTWICLGPGVS
jgi:hypothetical protein